MKDSGTYTCQSGIGRLKRTKTASLIVYGAHKYLGIYNISLFIITTDLPEVSFDNLHCNVSGSNISEVLLIRNGFILKRMPVDHSSVNLRLNLSTASGGMYQCLANSKYGSVQKSIYLGTKY